MTDIREQIERSRRAVGEQCTIRVDYPFEADLLQQNADTMEKLLAVYEAAMRLKPWKQHWGEELAEALAAVEER